MDAAATLETIRANPSDPMHAALPGLDAVFTYGGGPPVIAAYTALGARRCEPIYNALDPATHHPAPAETRFAADLAFLANRLPDRERRVEQFFLEAATLCPGQTFLLGGNGWHDKAMPGNVRGDRACGDGGPQRVQLLGEGGAECGAGQHGGGGVLAGDAGVRGGGGGGLA